MTEYKDLSLRGKLTYIFWTILICLGTIGLCVDGILIYAKFSIKPEKMSLDMYNSLMYFVGPFFIIMTIIFGYFTYNMIFKRKEYFKILKNNGR